MERQLDRPPYPSAGRALAVLCLVLATFAAGALAERYGLLPGGGGQPPALASTFRPFWQAWRLTEANYVDRPALDPTRMMRGAIRGMLASLGDVGHTTYLSPREVSELEASIKGEFEGIGAHMTLRQGKPTVMDVIPGSPAKAAGLKAGDELLKVNGKPVAEMPLLKIVQIVRGPAGTAVQLEVARKGRGKPLDLQITRGRVEVPSVAWHRLPGEPAAHLAIHSFGEHTDVELRKALAEIRKQAIPGLILDLRGNPGGLKEQAVAVTSEFLKGGDVFIEQNAKGERKPVPVRPGGVAQDIPLVVLIDEGTASSAEILAGAIQDYKRGPLVGTRTFGTGTVLQPYHLSDGSAILVATSEWLTPKGRQIWHHGITPDVEVTLPPGVGALMPGAETDLTAEGLAKSKDRQLLKALELLKKRLP